jgi:hypothetical protein
MNTYEGIDKIGLLLNPLLLKKDSKIKHIDPHNRLTLHQAGAFTVLCIHSEWFNPFFDYQIQMAWGLYMLIKAEVIDYPDTIYTPLCIYQNPYFFILNVVSAEFYSLFKEKNIEIDEDMVETNIDTAKEENSLYQYLDKKTGELTETYYSPDGGDGKKSKFICYDMVSKLKHDNNKGSIKELDSIENRKKCEYKIYCNNSDWLHWDNFKGDYKAIFNRHLGYLSVIYNTKVRGCLSIHGEENPNFKKVIKLAEKENKVRYTNKGEKLKKSITYSDDILFPKKKLSEAEMGKRKDEIVDQVSHISLKKRNSKNALEMNKIMQNDSRKHIKRLEEGVILDI